MDYTSILQTIADSLDRIIRIITGYINNQANGNSFNLNQIYILFTLLVVYLMTKGDY